MTTNRRIVKSEGSADYYPTPKWATQALMENESFEGSIWECAAGCGMMSDTIREYNPDVFASDLHDRGNPRVVNGFDFLNNDNVPDIVGNIITNPPYNLAEKFIHKSLINARHKVAMLLRLAFLEGAARHDSLFAISPPSRVLVFSERITFYPDGVQTGGTGTTAYGWFIWDKRGGIGKAPEISWIKPGSKKRS